MADDKKGAAAVLTGSTGNAAVDMTPRAAAGLLIGFGVGAALNELGVEPWQIGGLSTATVVLSLAAFDGIVRPRL